MCMVSQDKLIKEGIQYTDKLFDEISKRLEKGVLSSDTLEAFLQKTKAYTTNNPLVTTEYDKTMLKLILAETNNHKFSRPAQKELVRVTIENQVGELIRDVGEDIKESVRDIVKEGYNEGLSQQEIADNITSRVSAIKGRRARTIARTEIARTSTISDYVINTERGATHFYVECRNTACPICKKAWHEKWTPDNDESFTPGETSAGGKGWIGDKRFPVSDVSMLPPIHPNCRCVPYFIKEGGSKTKVGNAEPTKEQLKGNLTVSERAKYNNYKRIIDKHTKWLNDNPNASAADIESHKKKLASAQKEFDNLRVKALGGATTSVTPEITPKPDAAPKVEVKPKEEPKEETKPKAEPKGELETPFDTSKHLTKEQLDKMDFKELAEHHGAEYKGLEFNERDEKNYHVIEQTLADGNKFTIKFGEKAFNEFTKKGIATPNEIVHEVFKVPEALRKETNEIWFKNTTHGIRKTISKDRYDKLRKNEGGYNLSNRKEPRLFEKYDGPDHQIVINPTYFKDANKTKINLPQGDDPTGWKHVIHHEFTHSGDYTREMWKNKELSPISHQKEHLDIISEEMHFSGYANSQVSESFAEHGGYISRMESNPSEQNKKFKIKVRDEDGKMIVKEIDYAEYKKMYPKHYAYFMKKFKEGF